MFKFAYNITLLLFLARESLTIASSDYLKDDYCDISKDLVHPFLKRLQKANTQRYKFLDEEEDVYGFLEVNFT